MTGLCALGLVGGRLLVRLGGERDVQVQHLTQINHRRIRVPPPAGASFLIPSKRFKFHE